MTAFIYTTCPECGELLRVNVEFPHSDRGFTSKKHICEHCSCEMLVEDKHVYKNGKIVRIGY